MSSRTKKIGIKEELREMHMKYDAVGMYFREYKLNEHFLLWINAMKEETPLPPKLVVKKEEDQWIK